MLVHLVETGVRCGSRFGLLIVLQMCYVPREPGIGAWSNQSTSTPFSPPKRMILRLLVAVVAGIALPLALHAQEILFGASVQLTGSTANTGRYYRDGYEFAIDKINAAGGVKVGNAGQKLALKLYDNQSDVNLSVRQYVQNDALPQSAPGVKALRRCPPCLRAQAAVKAR